MNEDKVLAEVVSATVRWEGSKVELQVRPALQTEGSVGNFLTSPDIYL